MSQDPVVDHYARPDLIDLIDQALVAAGIEPVAVTVDQLAPMDEFHLGGRPATHHLFDRLDFGPNDHLVDIGCGIGGAARVASTRVSKVTGFDLTPEYIVAGRVLNSRLGLDRSIDLQVGDALSLPADAASFDGGYMLHVGMNIEDKDRLLAEIARVLAPGARFGIYDIMRVGDGQLSYPVPWASDTGSSHLGSIEDYRRAAIDAGLVVLAQENRAETAKNFFRQLAQAASDSPPPLGLQVLMGPTIAQKVANMAAAVQADIIAPVEFVVEHPAGWSAGS